MNKIHLLNTDTTTFQIAETENMILAAKHLCHDVYLEVGYIKKPLANRIIPYEHDASSSYIVALNFRQEVIGTLRIIQEPPFTTFEVWKDKLYPACSKLIADAIAGHSFEIGALAVRKDFRGKQVSWGLYKAAYLHSLALSLGYGIISMDAGALHSLEALGWYVVKIGDPMYYFGSLTVPGIMPVSKQAEHFLQNNLLHQKLLVA
jgi:GNAT superfamily N-acetyltransferase